MSPQELADKIDADIRAWTDVEGRAGCVISNTPYLVMTDDYGLALHVSGNVATPVPARPSATGMVFGATMMTREDAERVAKIRGDGYQAVLGFNVAPRRIEVLRQMRAMLDAQ